MRFILIALGILLVLAAFLVWPPLDLIVSGLFYVPDQGFFLRDVPAFDALHVIAYGGARILGLVFLLLAILAAGHHRPVAGLDAKAWLFLFLGLLIAPGLIANGVFKDHWGRARPREITEFGGELHFSPALIPANECVRNCSFVSGDGAFGFFLPAFAYVAPRPKSRRLFWTGMGFGALFGFARLAVGAHFLSDNLFAAFFVQATLALLYAIVFGWKQMQEYWRLWFFFPEKSIR